jgi:hypothetical protein
MQATFVGLLLVAQRIVHGAVEHMELLLNPAVVMTLSLTHGSVIIPACS